jgi:pimeloyl-ACP methyl ester carboxylesterase
MVPHRFGEELASRIAGSRLVLLDGCGHMIAPDRYSPVLLEFLRKNKLD